MKKTKILVLCMVVVFSAAAVWADALTALQAGADRLVGLQNLDGGWDWPLDDGNPASISPPNTIGPIGMGLAQAYRFTGGADHLTALGKAGAFLLTKTNNFSPSDGYLAAQLDRIFGGITYTDHVNTNFYIPLKEGTYNKDGAGTLYDTAGYVNLIRTSRAGSQANMAAWDIGIGLVGAASVWASTSEWVDGTKAEINELDGSNYYDVLGLAGAVYGLAFVGEDFDPTAGQHAAAASLRDLADILAGYQITATGGFTWNSGYISAGYETNQETAYAILALNKVDRYSYFGVIQNAASYLKSVQLSSGGWDNYSGDPDGEDNEITGEALWAIAAAQGDTSVTLVPASLNAARRSTVTVSLNMSLLSPITMDTITAIILYNHDVFTYEDASVVVKGGLLTHNWELYGNEFAEGHCKVGGIDLNGFDPNNLEPSGLPWYEDIAAGSGTLFTFKLKVKADAPLGPSALTWGVYDGHDNATAGFDYGDADGADIILPESALHGVSINIISSTQITLASLTAKPFNGEVVLEWKTESEIDNAGFNLYRSESEDGEYVKINDSLISAEGSPTQGATYQFVDESVKNRTTYYYKLEDIDLNGTSTMHGPVSAVPRLVRGMKR
jgi:hypothetical protein